MLESSLALVERRGLAGKDRWGALRMPITPMRLTQFIRKLKSCEKVTSVGSPHLAKTSTPRGLFSAQPVSASLGCVKCRVTLCGPGKESATLEVSDYVLDPDLSVGIVRDLLRECQLFGPNGQLRRAASQMTREPTKCNPCKAYTAGKSPFFS